jgi:hypothetical protein
LSPRNLPSRSMYKKLILLLLLVKATTASAQYNWLLKNNKDGIKVYTSAIPNSKFKAIKVDADLKATPSQLVKVLLDVKACTEWVYHTKLCVLVKQVSPAELYYYSEVSIPWPVTNRDFVAHLTAKQDAETGVVTVDGPVVSGMVPEKDGIVRVTTSKGLWLITPKGKGEINVVYTLQLDPGGNIPAWLINLFATEGPTNSFNALKEQIKKPQYLGGLPFIKD